MIIFFNSKYIMLHRHVHILYKYMDNSFEFHFFIYVYNFFQIFFTWKFYYFMGEGVMVLGSQGVNGALGVTRGEVCVGGRRGR